LREMLASWKFKSVAVSSGRKALAVMEKAIEQGVTIDCILLDYQMPEMDGGAVVEALKADPDFRDVPIVMLTSVDNTEEGRSFLSLGVSGHLTKPLRSALLRETITEAMLDSAWLEAQADGSIETEPEAPLRAGAEPRQSRPDVLLWWRSFKRRTRG